MISQNAFFQESMLLERANLAVFTPFLTVNEGIDVDLHGTSRGRT